MFHSGPLYLILLFQVVIACTYRQSVPVEVKIACILYVPMIISIYILCLDRIALKMQPNIVEAVTASHVGQLGFPWHFSLVSQTFYNRIIVFFSLEFSITSLLSEVSAELAAQGQSFQSMLAKV